MISVIGIGNLERGDDALGRLIARQIRDDDFDDVRVIEQGADTTRLVELLSESEAAFIADAADFGAPAGYVHTFDAARESVPEELAVYSSHGIGLAQAIETARSRGCLPGTCRIYSVQAASFDLAESVSPPVAAAIPLVAAHIERAIESYRVRDSGALPAATESDPGG
jgi:hydrogenase maturation protease